MNARRRIMGIVTSDKMDKTVVVEISRTYRHPLVGKLFMISNVSKHMMKRMNAKSAIKFTGRKRSAFKRKRWVVESIIKRDEKKEIVEEITEELAAELKEGAQE